MSAPGRRAGGVTSYMLTMKEWDGIRPRSLRRMAGKRKKRLFSAGKSAGKKEKADGFEHTRLPIGTNRYL